MLEPLVLAPLKAIIVLFQCKITDYLPESKLQFNTAIRKQKLDKILNLIKTEPTSTNVDPTLPNVTTMVTTTTTTLTALATTETSVESLVKSETTANISTTATTTTATATTTESEENSSSSVVAATQDAESHSVATPTLASVASTSSSSTSVTPKDSDVVFEIPQAIRFPLNRNNLEVVVCKWASCGQEFDSNGKLLDHLKVNSHTKMSLMNKIRRLSDHNSPWQICQIGWFSDMTILATL